MYDSEIGRFTRPDPALDIQMGSPGSWNLYAYVGNNPVNRTDPTGGQITAKPIYGDGLELLGTPPPLLLPPTYGDYEMHAGANVGWCSMAEESVELTWGGATRSVVKGLSIAEDAAVTMIPVVGEVGDIYFLLTGTPEEKFWSTLSLCASVPTFGISINYSGVRLATQLADSVPDVARGVDGFVDGTKAASRGGGKTFDQARTEAFESAGMTDLSKVKATKFDEKTGTAVEFKGEGGAKLVTTAPISRQVRTTTLNTSVGNPAENERAVVLSVETFPTTVCSIRPGQAGKTNEYRP